MQRLPTFAKSIWKLQPRFLVSNGLHSAADTWHLVKHDPLHLDQSKRSNATMTDSRLSKLSQTNPPSANDLTKMMTDYLENGQYSRAQECFGRFKEQSLSPTPAAHHEYLRSLVKQRKRKQAIDMFWKVTDQLEQKTLLWMMRMMIKERDLENTSKLATFFESNDSQLDLVVANSLVQAYAFLASPQDAHRIFKGILDTGEVPTDMAIHAFIKSTILYSQDPDCFQLLEDLISNGQVTESHWLSLMQSFARSAELTRAKLLWNSLPNDYTRNPQFMEAMLHCMVSCFKGMSIRSKHEDPGLVAINQSLLSKLAPSSYFDPSQAEFGLTLATRQALAEEALQFFQNYIVHQGSFTTPLLDRFMQVMLYSTIEEYQVKAIHIFDEYENLGLTKGPDTYFIALRLFTRPFVFNDRGQAFWQEYLEWDTSQERELCQKQLTNEEMEQVRQAQGRSGRTVFNNFCTMVDAYTK
jgi:hypothetical protein